MDLMVDIFRYLADAIMPDKTAIVGDASASFMYTRRNETRNYSSDLFYIAGAALVFVKDQHKPDCMSLMSLSTHIYTQTHTHILSYIFLIRSSGFNKSSILCADMGEIEFHVTLSPGLMPFGPQIKTISSYETPTHSSWISAVMSEFEGVFIDSHTILRELQSQVRRHEYLDRYIVKLSIYHKKKKMKNRKKV